MEVALFFLSFVGILLAAELFTNAVEDIGDRLNLSHGVVGSILAAIGTALPETVKRWARGRLRAGFLPRYFVPVDELPRNALGKLLRSALKPIARERLQSQNA